MKDFSASSTRTLSFFLLILLFTIYFINADKVYHFLSGKPYTLRLPDELLLHAEGDMICRFPVLRTVKNKFGEGVLLNGQVAAVSNIRRNPKVLVFFRSSTAVYEVIDSHRSYTEDSTRIKMNLFTSTAGLKSGVYQIGMYLSDDEGVKFSWLNSFFEKAVDGPEAYTSRSDAMGPARISKDLRFVIEQIVDENQEFVFYGWVVLNNAEMDDYNAYLIVKDSSNISKAYYVPLYTRMDIASMYGDTRAANSGIQIRVPHFEFVSGTHSIKVLLKSRKSGELVESEQTEVKTF